MCTSCGCGMVDEDHGDNRNITMADLQAAADAAGVSVDEVVQNIQDSTIAGEEEMRGYG